MIISDKVLLIVPCYNEAARLQGEVFLKKTAANVHLLFADDGSQDSTWEIIHSICQDRTNFFSYRGSVNRGKANVIFDAYQFFLKNHKLAEYQWIGFWDSDLATPLEEVNKFLVYQKNFAQNATALFGCRLARYGSEILRSPIRHYLSRVFVTFTDFILGVKAYDSQCGAKLFHNSIVDKVFSEPFISKWIFDLEIILRVGSDKVIEIPVFKWSDVPGSKMKIGREIFRVLKDLFKIRTHYLSQRK